MVIELPVPIVLAIKYKKGIKYGKQQWWCRSCDSWHLSAIKDGSQIR